MHVITNFKVGQTIACKYPKHGTRNILCNQEGKILKAGVSANGLFATIQRLDGTYRTLSLSRMIDPVIS